MNNNELMSTLMNVLNNQEAKDKLLGAVSSLNNKSEPQVAQNETEEPIKPQAYLTSESHISNDVDMIAKIKTMLDSFNNTDDTRIGLLASIKPYMREGRSKNIDLAIKFVQLINFASKFKNS